ncbi:ADP-ribosylglycohydrolase-domain-containing protein [Corynascus novoguineensis]|uniref:ADP-ribosylglycohydrolase-domain-containing protein n=1 Tax=Corynascus novoguineensis TaxID=1126955 RepID=A0AAN7CNJ7_9PEZI|nr:ADP-ribosylglycohydrolase-domain-containing protein [Corynascus novoguineensis]
MSSPEHLLPSSATVNLLQATLRDRVTGALVGAALGDAIGLYTEFLSAAHAAEAYPSRRFTLAGAPRPTPFKLDSHRAPKQPGDWTDDTDHALLLLLSFLHTARATGTTSSQLPPQLSHPPPLPSQQDLARRLRVWANQGFRPLETMPLGLGRLVGTVLSTAGFEADPEQVARAYWERTGRRVAPNGSLMRTHPLGAICAFREEGEAFEAAAALSSVTHVDPRCVVACVIGTGLVRALVRGEVAREEDVDAVVQRAVGWYRGMMRDHEGELDKEELLRHVALENGLDDLNLDEQAAIGYVYKTLGSGVHLLRLALRRMAGNKGALLERSRLFEELITDLIMRGGDADTNACFAGALLGAYLGYASLPDHWKHGLRHQEWLLGKCESLCQVLGLREGEYNGQEDRDTEAQGGKPAISEQDMEGRWMALQQTTFKKMEEAAKASASKAAGSSWSLPWQRTKIKQ